MRFGGDSRMVRRQRHIRLDHVEDAYLLRALGESLAAGEQFPSRAGCRSHVPALPERGNGLSGQR
jgi:hypothetical protein